MECMPQHRVTLTDGHYDLVRRFMVARKLPSARAATERMIELAANGTVEGLEEGNNGGGEVEENDQRHRAISPLLARKS